MLQLHQATRSERNRCVEERSPLNSLTQPYDKTQETSYRHSVIIVLTAKEMLAQANTVTLLLTFFLFFFIALHTRIAR